MLRSWLTLSALLSAGAIVLVTGFLFSAAWPLLQQGPTFLWGAEWYPYEGLYGLLPAVLGTLWTVGIALLLAVPAGVAAAIFSVELLPMAGRRLVRFVMELLAGVPSVVYGLMGLWVLLPFLEQRFGLLTGHSLLAAGLLLALMIVPTIMVLSEDALHGVRKAQREAAANLGLDWSGCLLRVLLPQSWPGIRTGILLALGRAMGETIAVMLVVGSVDRLPDPWYRLLQPAQSLTSRIGREMAEAVVGSLHWAALMTCGLLLALAAMAVALLAGGARGRT